MLWKKETNCKEQTIDASAYACAFQSNDVETNESFGSAFLTSVCVI
jgi:hypothetical protein